MTTNTLLNKNNLNNTFNLYRPISLNQSLNDGLNNSMNNSFSKLPIILDKNKMKEKRELIQKRTNERLINKNIFVNNNDEKKKCYSK